MARLNGLFFNRPSPEVARDMAGKLIVHRMSDSRISLRITEAEAYFGEADSACHAHKGRTGRTDVMWAPAGTVYIYLCYGMHWMLNIVTGKEGSPEAVLIRACDGANGPGKLTKALRVTGELNRSNVLEENSELYIEDDGFSCDIIAKPRVGIDYASKEDRERLWRFCIDTPHG